MKSASIINRIGMPALLLAAVVLFGGCRVFNSTPDANLNSYASVQNPLTIPLLDRWLVMDEISDELDNYFRIYREERIRLVDSVLTEGWIETHPKIGASVMEPWHEDSTAGFERLHATLQTVRRFAKVRVIPIGGAYQVDVKVYKELENLKEPLLSTVRGRTLRHDSSLDSNLPEYMTAPFAEPRNKGWIPMGRDFTLEQQILRNIQGRLTEFNTFGE